MGGVNGPAFAGDIRPGSSVDSAQAAAVMRLVRTTMSECDLRSVIVRVTIDGKNLVTRAVGESMTGVPATTDMHFRNGAVSIGYMASVLLQLVDEGRVRLDDKVAKWLPTLPHADEVTLEQLARMTAGYHDFVQEPEFAPEFYGNPFREWTTRDQLHPATDLPLWYSPGTNWNYSHTDYVILGLALEKITGQPLATLIRTRVLDPLGLKNTHNSFTAHVPQPTLHVFSSERREFLGVSAGTPFYEESTYWNPSWTLAHGAIQTTNIYDLNASAIELGTGSLLSPESARAMISTDLRGFGSPVPGCFTCRQNVVAYSYGIGAITTGNWVKQNPQFAGTSAVEAYLPSKRIAIAVATTYGEGAFSATGESTNEADVLFRAIGRLLAPEDAPPG